MTTEGIKKPEGQADKRERDLEDRRETACQAEWPVIRQTDCETQVTTNGEEREGGANPPTLDLDGEVEMQDGER